MPSEERKFLDHMIEIIEEKSVSDKGRIIAFNSAKSVMDLFVEFEEDYIHQMP